MSIEMAAIAAEMPTDSPARPSGKRLSSSHSLLRRSITLAMSRKISSTSTTSVASSRTSDNSQASTAPSSVVEGPDGPATLPQPTSSEPSKSPTAAAKQHVPSPAALHLQAPYRPSLSERALDVLRTSMIAARVVLNEVSPSPPSSSSSSSSSSSAQSDKDEDGMNYSGRPVSERGRFVASVVEPLAGWWGRNPRILLSACRGRVDIFEPATAAAQRHGGRSSVVRVVNGASHNYAGLYALSDQAEALHRLCLDRLPLADEAAVPQLAAAARQALASFWRADWAECIGTGYGSNYVALPALIRGVEESEVGVAAPDGDEVAKRTAVVMDDKCHNSMFTGMFLGKPGCLKKFRHNDIAHLEELLQELKGVYTRVIVAIEGLYSMEGSVPPLDELYRLKQTHSFILFCDEAHSFLSLGSTGRGCIEYWNETRPDSPPLPLDLFDMRTATLSKAVGGLGGVICGRASLAPCVRSRLARLASSPGHRESTPSYTLVSTLWALRQPRLVARNLTHLRDISRTCRARLAARGVRVYGDDGVPMLPLFAGPPALAGKLSYELRREGLLATPVTTPAVPYWESRVRVNLSAEHTEADVDRLVAAVVAASARCGLLVKKTRPADWDRSEDEEQGATKEIDREQQQLETAAAFERIQALIMESSAASSAQSASSSKGAFDSTVVAAGHASRARYGVGSGGARWVCGTFEPHLEVERLLGRAVSPAADDTFAALTYADWAIGLASTVAALCRPLLGYRRHVLLVPAPRPAGKDLAPVEEGVAMAPKKGRPEVGRYAGKGVEGVCEMLRNGVLDSPPTAVGARRKRQGKTYFTVVVEVRSDADVAALSGDLARLAASLPPASGATVLVSAPGHLLSARDLGVVDGGPGETRKNVQVLVCTSLYRTLGIPVAFLAGSAPLVRELRYWSRGYMFTTSPPAFVMDMAAVALRQVLERRKEVGV